MIKRFLKQAVPPRLNAIVLAGVSLALAGVLALAGASAYSAPGTSPLNWPAAALCNGTAGLLNLSPALQYKCGPLTADRFEDANDPTLTYVLDPAGTTVLGGELWLGPDTADVHLIKDVEHPVDPSDVATKAYVACVFEPPTADVKANDADAPPPIPYNTAATISWTSANATGCTINQPLVPEPSGAPTAYSASSGNLTAATTYTVACDCLGVRGSDSVRVDVLPFVDIKANNSDGPISIPYKTSATIKWTSASATSCSVTASPGSANWSGLSGTQSTGDLTQSTVYTATCNNAVGSASDKVTVNVDIGSSGRFIFATSQRYSGNLGGIGGANQACQALADARYAATGDIKFAQTYKAWVSTGATSARNNIGCHLDANTRFVDIFGNTIANNCPDLTDGTLQRAVNYLETGALAGSTYNAWTGTKTDGTLDAQRSNAFTCFVNSAGNGDWRTSSSTGPSARVGLPTSATATWTQNTQPSCSSSLRLYCVAQPFNLSRAVFSSPTVGSCVDQWGGTRTGTFPLLANETGNLDCSDPSPNYPNTETLNKYCQARGYTFGSVRASQIWSSTPSRYAWHLNGRWLCRDWVGTVHCAHTLTEIECYK